MPSIASFRALSTAVVLLSTVASVSACGSGNSEKADGSSAGSGAQAGTGGATSASGGSTSQAGKASSGGHEALGGDSGAAGSAGPGAAGSASQAGSSGASGGTAAGSGGGGSGAGGGTASGGGGGITAGNPDGACSSSLPARAKLVDTTTPTTVVGTGTAGSCSFSALNAAVTKGGIITFDCGPSPVTVAVTATLKLPTNKDTVLDGGNKVTLDGGGAVQILSFNSANFQATESSVTLQRLTLQNAKATPTEVIPDAPAPCSQGYNDGEGGALYMRDGNLNVIDCVFRNNQAAPLGPDTGGGAIYIVGSKHGATIANSTFIGNSASNAGAVGGLFSELDVYNSLFKDNKALGHDANNNEPNKCSAMNNGQNETGSGGNGGAIYSDGNSVNVLLCGNAILNNAAGVNAFGGGLFFTSNNMAGTLTIQDTTISGNTGGYWTNVSSGSVTNAGSAVGTNCKSITITSSTIQGL